MGTLMFTIVGSLILSYFDNCNNLLLRMLGKHEIHFGW